jgi:hypothetical protein
MLKTGAAPFVLPLLQSPQAQTRRAAIQLLLRSGMAAAKTLARSRYGRVRLKRKMRQAARRWASRWNLIFSYLDQLIRMDESPAVVGATLVCGKVNIRTDCETIAS